MANIYDDFIIVDEKSITDLRIQSCCGRRGCDSEFSDRTAFSALEFTMVNHSRCLQIKDIASHSTNASEPLAQIVLWKWKEGAQKIEKVNSFPLNITLNKGKTVEIDCDRASIVIRILKKRQVIENPCPPLSSPDDDLTIHIGDRQVTLSANWLMVVSPVVKRMLSVDMKEKQQRTLNLDGHDITMEQFMQFLETVTTIPTIVGAVFLPEADVVAAFGAPVAFAVQQLLLLLLLLLLSAELSAAAAATPAVAAAVGGSSALAVVGGSSALAVAVGGSAVPEPIRGF